FGLRLLPPFPGQQLKFDAIPIFTYRLPAAAGRWRNKPDASSQFMSMVSFSFPTPTLFGAGCLSELPARLKSLGISRPLVVTDPGLINTDAFAALTRTLGPHAQGKEWFVYSGVHPNPIENDVRESAAQFKEHSCDAVIAIGGGSPLDVGKAARLL